jgi:hypothetical protein
MDMSMRYPRWAFAMIPLALAACNALNAPTGATHILTPATVQRGVAPFGPVAGGQWLLLTCADCGNGAVYFYHGEYPSKSFKSLAVDNAFALAVDDLEDLYISGGGRNSPTVITEEYANGGSFSYSDMVNNPTNVAPLAGGSPGFYVANGPQEIFFPEQGIDRSNVLTDNNLADVRTTTVDSLGDTYVGGSPPGGDHEVDVIRPGEKPAKLKLDLTGLPVGLVQDTQGDLIVDEQDVGVAVFAPNKPSPIYWFDNKNGPHPVSIVLGNHGGRLYVLDNATVYVYKYPEGKQLWEYSVPHSLSCCTAQIAIEPRMPLFDPGLLRTANSKFRYWTDFVPTDR